MTHEVYLLPEDREYALERIRQLEEEIQGLGPEFQDVFTQSSETWHDNAPFDALRDKQSMLAAELDQLRRLIRQSVLDVPKRKRGTIGIGDTVTLDNGRTYRIAGDWTHHAGRHVDGIYWVSSHTPVAKALLGKKRGDTIHITTLTAIVKDII